LALCNRQSLGDRLRTPKQLYNKTIEPSGYHVGVLLLGLLGLLRPISALILIEVLLSATVSTPFVALHVAFIIGISAITHDLANVSARRDLDKNSFESKDQ
jgi:hypothetical protein